MKKNLISTVPLVPPIVDTLEAEAVATKQAIQEIITQYQGLGWTDVRPLDMGGIRLPRIVCWSEDDKFSIHVELHQATGNVNFTNIFTMGDNGAIAGCWFKGHHLAPAEVQAIIRLVKGEEVEAKEETEETGALAEYNHRYNK